MGGAAGRDVDGAGGGVAWRGGWAGLTAVPATRRRARSGSGRISGLGAGNTRRAAAGRVAASRAAPNGRRWIGRWRIGSGDGGRTRGGGAGGPASGGGAGGGAARLERRADGRRKDGPRGQGGAGGGGPDSSRRVQMMGSSTHSHTRTPRTHTVPHHTHYLWMHTRTQTPRTSHPTRASTQEHTHARACGSDQRGEGDEKCRTRRRTRTWRRWRGM